MRDKEHLVGNTSSNYAGMHGLCSPDDRRCMSLVLLVCCSVALSVTCSNQRQMTCVSYSTRSQPVGIRNQHLHGRSELVPHSCGAATVSIPHITVLIELIGC